VLESGGGHFLACKLDDKKRESLPPNPIKMTIKCIELLFATEEKRGRGKDVLEKFITNLNERSAKIIFEKRKRTAKILIHNL
jgi:hypothetical protein